MHMTHLALWVQDLERLKAFYETYFGVQATAKYVKMRTHFQSYFLTFASGTRVELMQRPDIPPRATPPGQECLGYAHLAMAVGSAAAVNALTQRVVADGYPLLDGPRWTGDGDYASVLADPEGNRIEITV